MILEPAAHPPPGGAGGSVGGATGAGPGGATGAGPGGGSCGGGLVFFWAAGGWA